jgi:HEAT repeat protein
MCEDARVLRVMHHVLRSVRDVTMSFSRPAPWLAPTLLALLAGCGGSNSGAKFADEGKSPTDLRAMLADPDATVRARGAFGLSRAGAVDAVPQLADLLRDPDPLVRQNAALALGSAGPTAAPAVPGLTTALGDSEWAVRRQAAVALGQIGRDAKPAGHALAKLDADPSRPVREAAKQARTKIDPR